MAGFFFSGKNAQGAASAGSVRKALGSAHRIAKDAACSVGDIDNLPLDRETSVDILQG